MQEDKSSVMPVENSTEILITYHSSVISLMESSFCLCVYVCPLIFARQRVLASEPG
jgi:hypothetical protein